MFQEMANDLRGIKEALGPSGIRKIFLAPFLIFQLFISYNYVKNKAIDLKPFIDEYVSLSSNYHLVKELNFSAGGFLGGTFSVYLTSGPISAIGSVFGWIATNDIFYSRIFNYYWICFLLIICSYTLIKKIGLSNRYVWIFPLIVCFTIPWWQGMLYSLGEIPSVILITTAMLLFNKSRKLSLLLFGFSIFLGKLLNILIFAIFYLTHLNHSRSLKTIFNDFVYFLIPLIPWLTLIQFTYNDGGLIKYFFDLYYFVGDSNASGIENDNFSLTSLKQAILLSEYSQWNIYEKIRIGIIPILGSLLILKNRKILDLKFGYVTIPIFLSLISTYLWFWILNPLKWMRYSQHFTAIIIFLLLYLIIFDIFEKKYDFLAGSCLLILYLDNTKKYLIYFLILITVSYFIKNTNVFKASLIYIVAILMTLDITAGVIRKGFREVSSLELQACNTSLNNDECRDSYFEILNE